LALEARLAIAAWGEKLGMEFQCFPSTEIQSIFAAPALVRSTRARRRCLGVRVGRRGAHHDGDRVVGKPSMRCLGASASLR